MVRRCATSNFSPRERRSTWRRKLPLFFGGDGWYPAPNQITIDWGWTCPIPINYNHQWSSNHQLINDNSPYTLHKLWLIKWFPRWNGHLRDSFCRSFDSATTIARHELIMVATRSGGPVTGVQTSDALAWRETFSKDWDQHNLGKLKYFTSH